LLCDLAGQAGERKKVVNLAAGGYTTFMFNKFFTVARTQGSVLAVVGYLLSPLSWWNDLFINIPLAYLFASLCGMLSASFFMPCMVLGYWLTNIAGLILLHKGAVKIAGNDGLKQYGKAIRNKSFYQGLTDLFGLYNTHYWFGLFWCFKTPVRIHK
jgi:hypothetical protein